MTVARHLRFEWLETSSVPTLEHMKTGRLFYAAILATGMIASPVKADTAVSVDFFYEHLEPHGSWFEMDDYGYVWQPYDIADEWNPYGDGRWVYTDAGWTWMSNEPYGWAVYHYGRWSNVRDVGWVWVPGTEWGPGWVSWRRSPEYVGWAPLPPEARFTAGVGFSSWVDRYYDIGPGHYRFVEVGQLGAPRMNAVFVDRSQNITIINRTTNITNISRRGDVIYNGGPDYDEQVRASREPIPRYRLDRRREAARESGHADTQLQARVEGDTLRVADLPVSESRERRAPKAAKKIENAEVDRGWRGAGSPEEIAAVREKFKGDGEVPSDLPAKPAVSDRLAGKGKGSPRENATPEAPGTERMKGDRPRTPPEPGLPPAPKEKGKEMKPGEKNLPPDPSGPRPAGERPDREKGAPGAPAPERPMQRPEERRESKGTKKDPAEPGTEVAPVPPAPAAPVSPRPPAPGQGKGKGGDDPETRRGSNENPPHREQPGQNQSGPRMSPPPAPGGSSTPPLPPEATPGRPEPRPAPSRGDRDGKGTDRSQPAERPAQERASGPAPQRNAPPENAPARDREKEKEIR